MHVSAGLALLLPVTVAGWAWRRHDLWTSEEDFASSVVPAADQSTPTAIPASVMTPNLPLVTPRPEKQKLELRQDPANAAAASPSTTAISTASGSSGDFTTVQWIETYIGGTYSTWVPKTIFFHYPDRSTAPRPGVGAIGMGTLTGVTGVTKTIVAGGAPSKTPTWQRGIVVAVGAGVVGMVV